MTPTRANTDRALAFVAMLVVPLIALLVPPAARAQAIYRCSGSSGNYISDKPCAGVSQTELRSFGPAPDRAAYNTLGSGYQPSMGKAPDILPYLGPECAQMNDAVRTGPARGLRGAAYSELVFNYRRRCAEDEANAQRKMQQVEADDRSRRQSLQREQSARSAQARLTVEQCDEMLRIRASKRRRAAGMSIGEQRDLEAFETIYQTRCKAS